MSDYCPQHPRYSAKRAPNSLCGNCFRLWFLRNPELKHDGERMIRVRGTDEVAVRTREVRRDG